MKDKIIDMCNKINKIDDNKYFKKLQEFDIIFTHLPDFILTQKLFAKAVDHWSRVLGKLLDKVPSHEERLVIVRNLYDEHGNGNILNSHVETFNRYLLSMENIYGGNIEIDTVNNPATIFNKELDGMLENKSWIYSVAALGMIEYTYITVSKIINKYITNFITQDKIEHYSLHEILDVEHATELFSIINKFYDSNNDEILAGIRYGYEIFNKLYNRLDMI